MVKYIHNSWLATKVASSEIYSKCPEVDYDEVTDILGMFKTLETSLMKATCMKRGYWDMVEHVFPKMLKTLLKIIDSQDPMES